MRLLIRIIKNGLLAMLTVAVLLGIWQLAARAVFKQDLPELFGYSNLAVLSGSMEPAISTGDLVVIHRQEHYKMGDIITYDDGGAFTTHRIVEETSGGFVTRGDANHVSDDRPVMPEQIRGRVVFTVPGLGNALLFLRTPVGLGLILVLGLLLISGEKIVEEGGAK